MSMPFLGEIRAFPFGRAPQGWAPCSGQLLQITQNTALFALLSNTYGGDGITTFAVPNIGGIVPIHSDAYSGGHSFRVGSTGGSNTATLSVAQMPAHAHQLQGDNSRTALDATNPSFAVPGLPANLQMYTDTAATGNMNITMVQGTGGNQAHNNVQPSLVLNYCIALSGEFPSRPGEKESA